MAGNPIDRLDLSAVALGGSRVEERDASPGSTRVRRDRSSPASPTPAPGVATGSAAGNAGTSAVTGSPAAVHAPIPPSSTARPRVPEHIEHPPEACRDRPARVVVDHHPVAPADPERRERGGERGGIGKWMSAGTHRGGQHRIEIDEHRAGQVRGRVCEASTCRRRQRPANVGDAEVGIVEGRRELRDGDEAHVGSIASDFAAGRNPPMGGGPQAACLLDQRGRATPVRSCLNHDEVACYSSGGAAPAARCALRPDPRRATPLRRSSVVERATVNRLVVGSNPTAGATVLSRDIGDI